MPAATLNQNNIFFNKRSETIRLFQNKISGENDVVVQFLALSLLS